MKSTACCSSQIALLKCMFDVQFNVGLRFHFGMWAQKKKKVQPKKKAASVANIEGNATAADGNPFAALAADSA